MHDKHTLVDRLSHAVDVVGTNNFHPVLCKGLSLSSGWDARMVMRYSKSARPEYLWSENVPDSDAKDYLSKFYRLDPFFAYWRGHDQATVLRMSDTPPSRRRQSNYFRVFQRMTGYRDGLGVFLPMAGSDAIAICYECHDPVPDSVVRLYSRLLPILQSLQSLHDRLMGETAPQDTAQAIQADPPADIDQIADTFLEGQLTPREREIVLMAIEGTSAPDIADQMELSEGTVRNHRKRLYKKLNIFSERELLALYIRHLTNAL
ncbi:hypothetical protein HW561_22060 [Rhodobacteraceae bacterium B1Z28]|uniref:HTH luxR-type domain-containing protein n=1 Tax=Ruegeria haliotis TaxID=2747601 RepID=A0ABX2PXS0_9RHOB|nr:LuxR family transcriptional regulator [Ruegeria haliotis]NVO58471.1 hypothetical protein [Ruegeria haliotis]